MNEKPAILLIYPHDFLLNDMGENVRLFMIFKYLHDKNFSIDLLAYENFAYDFSDFWKANDDGIVRNLFLFDYSKSVTEPGAQHEHILPDWTSPSLIRRFQKILDKNHYTYISVVYPYACELLHNIQLSKEIKKVFFIEDFCSIQRYTQGQTSDFGRMLTEEIQRIANFDIFACISYDEKELFQKIFPKKIFYFLPHFVVNNILNLTDRKKEVLFLGADNPYNVEGINWFMENVYPFLDKSMHITIAGNATKHININESNISVYGFVKDLDALWNTVGISICPLLNGTGMKIKVIESMSHGIPVVCTSRGVDGFPDHYESGCLVCDDPHEYANNLNTLFFDEEFYKTQAQKTNRYFSEWFSFERNTKVLDEIFQINNYKYISENDNKPCRKNGGLITLGIKKKSYTGLPLVSIITVVRNNPIKLLRTMNSVFTQTYTNIEYIIVDGDSTDNTLDIIKSREDELDYFISEPDTGIYNAINKGLGLVNGDYIGILNSDDWYTPDAVQISIDRIMKENADYSGAEEYAVDENGKTIGIYRLSNFDERAVFSQNPCNHGTMFISRKIYNAIGHYDEKYHLASDLDFQLRLVLDKRFKPAIIHEPIHYYEMTGASISKRSESLAEVEIIMRGLHPSLSSEQVHSLVYFMHEHNTDSDIIANIYCILQMKQYSPAQKQVLINEFTVNNLKYTPQVNEQSLRLTLEQKTVFSVFKRFCTRIIKVGKKGVKCIMPYGIIRIYQILKQKRN